MAKAAGTVTQIKVRVICPKCGKTKYIYLDKSNLSSDRGLSTILIPQGMICNDTFQIFVDKNGAVRGYEMPDFTLDFSGADVQEISMEEIRGKKFLEIIKTLFGPEILVKTLWSAILGYPLIIITEQSYLLDTLKVFFEKVLGDYKTEVQVVTTDEYNTHFRNIVYSSDYRNAIVFNPDIGAIIKQPFKKGGFRKEKFPLVESIIASIDTEKLEDRAITDKLSEYIAKVFEVVLQMKKEIEEGKIKNKKELDARLKKVAPKRITMTANEVIKILMERFGFDAEKIFLNVEEKLKKLSDIF